MNITVRWPQPPRFENSDPDLVMKPLLEELLGERGQFWDWKYTILGDKKMEEWIQICILDHDEIGTYLRLLWE